MRTLADTLRTIADTLRTLRTTPPLGIPPCPQLRTLADNCGHLAGYTVRDTYAGATVSAPTLFNKGAVTPSQRKQGQGG